MNLKLIAAIVLSVLLAAGSWLSYRAGVNKTELKYQKILTDLNAQSEKYRKQSEDKIHDLEVNRIAQNQDAELRIQALAKRLNIARRAKPTPAPGAGMRDCSISDDAVVVLAETASDPRISPPDNPSGFVGAEEAITADTVAAYSFYAITEYNQCATDFNALIRMVK